MFGLVIGRFNATFSIFKQVSDKLLSILKERVVTPRFQFSSSIANSFVPVLTSAKL